jgi:hypothetical protein
MKVIITNDSLDSLLSVQISTNGGQSYSTYSVSSLKDGLTFDCSPKDLKVICDVNTLKYIQVLADGEKASSSDIDLSNYIKIKDFYVDVYENPYYNKDLTKEEVDKLQYLESSLYEHRQYPYYCCGKDFEPYNWKDALVLAQPSSNNAIYRRDSFYCTWQSDDNSNYNYYYIITDEFNESFLDCDLRVQSDSYYLDDSGSFFTNARVHFIKHF